MSAMESIDWSQSESQGELCVKHHHNHRYNQAGHHLHLVDNPAHRYCGEGRPPELFILGGSEEGDAQNNIDQHARPLPNGSADGQTDREKVSQHLRSKEQPAESTQEGGGNVDILEESNLFSQKNT